MGKSVISHQLSVISTRFFFRLALLVFTSFLVHSCAQPGKSLSGGPKDDTPPVVMESKPANYSTNFTATEVEVQFDEYIQLKNLKKKLVISPVMEEKPDIRVKGKSLLIEFKSDLLPDRTYALNFGDALVDLNESNPFENFMYVFSTGDKIDSLRISGKVINARDNEPLEGAAVMLYPEDIDTLPITTLPTYLSITNKEGLFVLKNLAAGSYKIFALTDANANFRFDQPKEAIAFLDTLLSPFIRFTTIDVQSLQSDSTQVADSIPRMDTTVLADTLALVPISDSTNTADSVHAAYGPDNIVLYSFTEVLPRQSIVSTSRSQADKVEVVFNEALDSLRLELLYYSNDGGSQAEKNAPEGEKGAAPFIAEWGTALDSLSIWITDTTLAQRDSLVFVFTYNIYDSLEMKVPLNDSVRFNFRESKNAGAKENPFKITSNVKRTKEPGVPVKIRTSMPYEYIDTSLISVIRKHDILSFPESFTIVPDTLKKFEVRTSAFEHRSSQVSPRSLLFTSVFLPDSSYSVTFLPGAFTSYGGLMNDTTEFLFNVKSEDKYGSIKLSVEQLNENAVLQLLNSKGKTVREQRLSTSGSVVFALLKPGKYRFKLILDRNNNGKWDAGRYLKKLQPEKVLLYEKELDLKAKWDMEETWSLEDKE